MHYREMDCYRESPMCKELTSISKYQKIGIERSNYFNGVLAFVGPLTEYLTVSKKFVPPHCITSLTFKDNVAYGTVLRKLNERLSIVSVEFKECCLFMYQIEHIVRMCTRLQRVVVTRSMNVMRFPYFHQLQTESVSNNNETCITFPERKVNFTFTGCWNLFDAPNPRLSADQVVEIVMAALKHCSQASFVVLARFFRDSIGDIRHIDCHFASMDWKIASVNVAANRANVNVFVNESHLFVFYLKKQRMHGCTCGYWLVLHVTKIRLCEPHVLYLREHTMTMHPRG